MIRVVIADTNELIRIGLRTVLDRQPDVKVVDEALTRDQLKEAIIRHDPEVVLIDYASPSFSIDCVPEILQHNNKVRFVAITQNHTARTIENALKSGITSYIKKDCDLMEIVDSVTETAHGKKFFCGSILELLKEEAIDVDAIGIDPLTCAPISLSERELEIIALIAEGYTNQEVAEKLFLSAHTINTHRKNIMAKLGINNTAGIVMYAVKCNLVSPNKYLFSGQNNA